MGTRQASLLVVDDNDLNREMLTRRLQRKGYNVLSAIDGHQALEMLQTNRFDLILLDILMPGISGIEMLRRVRQVHSPTELPIIMATALDDSAQIVEALHLGANDYVTKPLDMPVVLARVQTQLTLKHNVDRIIQLERNLQQQNEELAQTNRWLEQVNNDLGTANRRMKADLMMAAQVQQGLLPRQFPQLPKVRFAGYLQSCTELAGDLLNVVRLDDQVFGVYILDVVGHGAAAAMLAAMVTRAVSRMVPAYVAGGPKPTIMAPVELARQLALEFPWDPETEHYFTILYGVLNLATLEFRFVSAGHPWPLRFKRSGEIETIEAEGMPIGWGESHFKEVLVKLEAGDRMLLYSDGLPEAVNEQRELYGVERIKEVLQLLRGQPLDKALQELRQSVDHWSGGAGHRDDISLVMFDVGEFAATEIDLTSPTRSNPPPPVPVLEREPDTRSMPWQQFETIPGVPTKPLDKAAAVVPPAPPLPPNPPTEVFQARPSDFLPSNTNTRPTVPTSGIPALAAFSFLASPEGPDEIGRLGHYRILRQLGAGGMAYVFEAQDCHLERRVALKVMKPDLAADEDFRQRFLREARAAAALDHDHIITIYQVGEDRGTPYFAMQLLLGESLEDRLRRDGKLAVGEVLRIARQITDGLAAAHEIQLIHRDIKPDNIWLERRAPASAPPRVKLLDFGLVRPTGGDGLTKTGLVMGTPSYMSPEQARGLILDVRADVFSLGSVMYRMCTGLLPFGEGDTMAILTRLAIDDPAPLRQLCPDLPAALPELITRMLAKRREDRPASAGEVLTALAAIEQAVGAK